MRHRNVDRGAIDLANGSVVPAGGFVDLLDAPGETKLAKKATDEDRALAAEADRVLLEASVAHPHNAAFIADGVLIPAPEKSTPSEETQP